jgi:hypothetical protein
VDTEAEISLRSLVPGDFASLTVASLPDLSDGTLGWSAVPCEVVRSGHVISGREVMSEQSLVAYESGLNKNIAPSALITVVLGDVATVEQNLFTHDDALGGLPVTDQSAFYVGQIVGLRDAAGVLISGTQEIIDITADEIELDGDFGGLMVAGCVLVLPIMTSALAADVTSYGFLGLASDNSILTGESDLNEYGEI